MSDYKTIKENLHGCSNHSCVIKKPIGMGTNGPCHCLDDRAKLQRFAYVRNEEIKDLQQQLLLSQKREMDLREALQSVLKVIKESDMWWIDCPDRGGFDAIAIEEVLSTPPNTAELEVYVESRLEYVGVVCNKKGTYLYLNDTDKEYPNETNIYVKKG